MLLSSDNLRGFALHGTDGDVGHVESFLFDETSWGIRYLVVDTGPFIFGRKVLLAPASVSRFSRDRIEVNLAIEQIRNSPSIDTEKPVSRQMEQELHQYYDWRYYWDDPAMVPAPAVPLPVPEPLSGEEVNDHPYPRSTREVTGYWVYSGKDTIGRVDDLIVDTDEWNIPCFVLSRKNNPSGKKVLIGTHQVTMISWRESAFKTDITAEVIEESPEFNPHDAVNHRFEEVLYDYYGVPHEVNRSVKLH
jgi:hypothetical protein